MPAVLDDTAITRDAYGLTITGTLTRDAWEDVGRELGEADSGNAWAIGDWLIAGARLPGNNWIGSGYREAQVITGLSLKSLGRRYTVARHYPRSERIEGASWTIHSICLRIKDKAERVAMIHHAIERGLTCEAVKNLVTGHNAATKRLTRALRMVRCPQCAHEFASSAHKVIPST